MALANSWSQMIPHRLLATELPAKKSSKSSPNPTDTTKSSRKISKISKAKTESKSITGR
jgi:hypothetical protein